MQLRKLLLATGATVAAGALALAPAAQATTPGGPINYVKVGADSTNGTNAATLTIKTPASVTMHVYGTPTTLNCYSGGATATVNRGTTGLNPNPAISFNTLSLNCDTFLQGQTTTISVPSTGCANFTATDTTVHDGLTDTGPVTYPRGKYDNVEGTFNAVGSTCQVTAAIGSSCTVKINGSTGMQFDEAVKTNGSQDLILKGSGLTVTSRTFGCLGMYGVGDPITINDIKFNTMVNGGAGAIDFRQTA